MKMISKNLRKSFLENNYSIKSWDFLSNELYNESEEIGFGFPQNPYIQNFIKTIERDTLLNFLTNMPPKAYSTVFDLKKDDLLGYLIDYLEEANDSYNSHVSLRLREKDRDGRDVRENRDYRDRENRDKERDSKDQEKIYTRDKEIIKDSRDRDPDNSLDKGVTNVHKYRSFKYDYSDHEEVDIEHKEIKTIGTNNLQDTKLEMQYPQEQPLTQTQLNQNIQNSQLWQSNQVNQQKYNIEQVDPDIANYLIPIIPKENEDVDFIIQENFILSQFEKNYLPSLSKSQNYLELPDIVRSVSCCFVTSPLS